MSRPSPKREQITIFGVIATGAILGGSAIVYYSGAALAYLSLILGLVFFAYAARYYIATVSVLLLPSADAVNGKSMIAEGA